MEQQIPPAPSISAAAKKSKKLIFIIIGVLVGFFILGGVIPAVITAMLGLRMKNALKDAGIDVNQKNGAIILRDEKGETVIGEKKLPANFPTDFPVFSGGKILSSSFSKSAAQITFMVAWATNKQASEVVEFYVPALERDGWTVTNRFSSGETELLYVKKTREGKNADGVISISQKGERGAEITVVLTLAN